MAGLRPSGLPRSGLVQRRFNVISDEMESTENSVQLEVSTVKAREFCQRVRRSVSSHVLNLDRQLGVPPILLLTDAGPSP